MIVECSPLRCTFEAGTFALAEIFKSQNLIKFLETELYFPNLRAVVGITRILEGLILPQSVDRKKYFGRVLRDYKNFRFSWKTKF